MSSITEKKIGRNLRARVEREITAPRKACRFLPALVPQAWSAVVSGLKYCKIGYNSAYFQVSQFNILVFYKQNTNCDQTFAAHFSHIVFGGKWGGGGG